MIESQTDLWLVKAEALCITTNGYHLEGKAAMGGGCAYEATIHYPDIAYRLGDSLKRIGNHVSVLKYDEVKDVFIVSFPTIPSWSESLRIRELVERSTEELLVVVNRFRWNSIVLPRPGCGIGGLHWEDVKPYLTSKLDDRFTIVSYANEKG